MAIQHAPAAWRARLASSPCATRRGAPKRMRSTSACSSISSGRPPSRVTVTMLPGAGSGARARKIADGLRTSRRPVLAHGEEAQLVRPRRSGSWWRARCGSGCRASLSKYSTVSTRCSSSRGPAMAPSLVTWPTMMTAHAGRPWRSAPAAAVHSRSCVHRAGARCPTAPDCTVWMESTISSAACCSARERQDGVEIGLARPARRCDAAQPEAPRAHADLRHGLLAAGVEHRASRRRRARPPAAAASTCRCRAHRPAGSPSPGSGRPRGPGRAPPCPVRRRAQLARRQARPGPPAARRRPPGAPDGARRCAARASSTRRTAGTGPAI